MTRWLLRSVGLLMMVTALAVALSRAPDRSVQSLVARWAPPPSDFIDLHGQLVHLRDVGPRDDAHPVLLLHGAGSSLHAWDAWARAWQVRHRVVSVDLPGFGLTGPWTGRRADADYRGDDHARFVIDLLDALAIPRASIVGHGFGGEVAWRTASIAPARVDRLLLVAPSGLRLSGAGVPPILQAWRVPGVAVLARHLLPRDAVAAALQAAWGDPARVTPALVDRSFELLLREGNRRALARRLDEAAQGGPEIDARLGRVAAPTLVLWGERDRVAAPTVGDAFTARVPGSRSHRLAGLGHFPHEEDAAAALAAATPFVDAPR